MLLARIKIVVMKVIKTSISDVVILEPRVFGDERGYFFESFSQREFNEQVAEVTFVQDNESKSSYGVVRGLHYQLPPYTQAKLVRVVEGEVLDVVVDLRKNSATFGKHVAVVLSGENKRQFFIPKGFAHGFAVLSPQAIFQYKCDNYYAPQYESGIQFDDPALGIDWKIPEAEMILSAKDRMHKRLEEAFVFEG
ncbi:dTDP-4-dehydrorhamnose 3,5-epimerase [Odoribacter splanchnicus]|jgi:dTDP-4-dehydrorhamnose 3,5-epimerase